MIQVFLFFKRFNYYSRQLNFLYIDAIVVDVEFSQLLFDGRSRTIDDFRQPSPSTLLHCVNKVRLLIFAEILDCHQVDHLSR